jgi:hypothetical protein
MKSIKKIRESVKDYRESEAYAQYLFRTNQTVSFDSWLEFMGAYNNKRKIAMPLRIIEGDLK